jgi:hypothetical protein
MSPMSLKCHHTTPPFMADTIDVQLEWQSDDRLWLRYHVDCDLNAIELPDLVEDPIRADGLWQTTCFELFLRDSGANEYLEFNFSPSRKWAAYRFDDYRQGMREWPLATPELWLDMSDTHVALEVTLALPGLVMAHTGAALSAVIHESGDIKSYWALKHPPGQPDFHHRDCFALQLSPPERA